MAMHPVLARGLDKSPPMTPVAATDRVIEGADGQPLGVRIYRNADLAADVTTPAVVWFHGGGFVMGDLETDDSLCRTIAERIGAVVVSVDYRLAPEHPFPAGVEDCYRSLCWVAGHSAELTVDPSRLAVGGTSARGGLAAAVALMTRDRGGPRLTFQFLGFPMLDDDADTWSMRQHCDPRVWDADACRRSWALYLGPIDGPPSPYAAPARAPDLADLAPAYVLVHELDPLADEDLAYATRLRRAGVATGVHVVPGVWHGFSAFVPWLPLARRATDRWIEAMGEALDRDDRGRAEGRSNAQSG